MKRKKDLVILCHCLLNSNSKVEGLAQYEGACKNLIKYLVDKGYGIIQLPCPEITMYGIKRWGHVKEQFDTPCFRNHCRNIFSDVMEQIIEYTKNGYTFKTLIGIDGSPSCGVNKTCSSSLWGGEMAVEYGLSHKIKDLKFIEAKGVFIEEISNLLDVNNIKINLIAIDEKYPESSLEKITQILERLERKEQ